MGSLSVAYIEVENAMCNQQPNILSLPTDKLFSGRLRYTHLAKDHKHPTRARKELLLSIRSMTTMKMVMTIVAMKSRL